LGKAAALYEDAPPDPRATIQALRALGYSTSSALADLIDNSVAALACKIDVRMHWAGSDDSWIAVVDDGEGMSEDSLRNAMRIGSWDPLEARAVNDLGRFGMGLKTASFSQSTELTVLTRRTAGGPEHVRTWDLEHVRQVGRWQLRRSAPPEAATVLRELDHRNRPGTIVLWRALDGVIEPGTSTSDDGARRAFTQLIASVEAHLAMTFSRLIGGRRGLVLQLNGRRIEPWDPFLADHPATQALPVERLSYRGERINVSAYVLPHRTKLSEQEYSRAAGPTGWNAQQGFYVYRAGRLITAGDWLNLPRLRRDDAGNLARIALEVPPALDHAWKLDITKSRVEPPAAIRDDLARIARATRTRAISAFRQRGGVVGGSKSRAQVTLWQQRRRAGQAVFKLNRRHPLIADLLASSERRADLSALLLMIEETIPVPLLPGTIADRSPFDGSPPSEVLEAAEHLYDRLLESGMNRRDASATVMTCEPFCLWPDLIPHLAERSR
jgi:hypothetical protein